VFENFKNIIDFYIRQKIRFSRKNYCAEKENVESIFKGSDKIASRREQKLGKKYNLTLLKENTTGQNYKENLYTLDILDKYLKVTSSDELKILDIGSKNWFYAKGEHLFFKAHVNRLEITGVELDAFRLYSNLYSRYEAAQFHIKGLENTKYIADDILNIKGKFHYITWFLPFVKKEPLMYWGLPLKFFMPEKLLRHAYSLLDEGGKMFILNQGEEEYEIQKKLLKNLNIPFEEIGEVKSEFLAYKHKRYGFIV